jgi:YidC/Oxa1 family membrane protein insertase
MDRNSIIGLFLIGILIIGYSIYTQPSEQERKAMQQRADSLALIKKTSEVTAQQEKIFKDSVPTSADTSLNDSAKHAVALKEFGSFSEASTGTEQLYTVENDLLKLVLSTKGGLVKYAELRNYKTYDGRPVRLMSGDSSTFNLSFPAQNRSINSKDMFYTTTGIVAKGAVKMIAFRLNAGDNKYIEYNYTLTDGSYIVGFTVNVNNLNDIIAPNATYLAFDWKENVIQQEKNIDNERATTTIYYHFMDDEVDKIRPSKDEEQSLKTKVKWISFKQQFFTSVLIADNAFDSPVVETRKDEGDKRFVKYLSASFAMPYEHKSTETYGMKYYFGPNHYQTLKKIEGLDLEKQIDLGWGIFGYVNKFIVIPIFNFLKGFNINFGIIILILTIIIRIIILPLTFGSFKSQAKIKVLAPEIKEINDKYGDDAMKKQQETMALYRKAGVNPLGGCIPGLLQLPILIAMFNFFPTSIELRQQSFLWAHDLSTYDSILDLGFKIPFYGNHVSLFTLLMTISTLLFTKLNMQMTSATNPQMKWMMYIMPILFLGVFNNYSAGLSYYYFLSNLFGLGQQYLFKAFIDEEAIHRQMQENKKKPVKKSGFQQRLEQMAKERGYQAKKR